jgi:hypothetical protein
MPGARHIPPFVNRQGPFPQEYEGANGDSVRPAGGSLTVSRGGVTAAGT